MSSYEQSVLIVFISFFVLTFTLDIVWASVIIFTIYLLEVTTNEEKYYPPVKKSGKDYYRESTSSIKFAKVQQEAYTISGLSAHLSTASNMFTRKKDSGQTSFGLLGQKRGEPKPSLMSLIHGKSTSSGSKENRYPFSPQQPLLAVVKNNMHLRRASSASSYNTNKSPLYRNMQSPATGRSFSTNSTSFLSPSIQRGFQSPVIPNSPIMYASPRHNDSFSELNTSMNNSGLEVHGSYFINRSLLQEKEEDVESFSLVNKSFNSPNRLERPASTNGNNIESSISRERRTVSTSNVLDRTSTEAVISVLKEKSKRKRRLQSEDTEVAKKTKLNEDTFDSTLNELFPPVQSRSPLRRRKLSSVRTSHKTYSTTGTQYEKSSDEENEGRAKKARKVDSSSVKQTSTKTTSPNVKFGLSEKEANDLMDDTDYKEPEKTVQTNGKTLLNEKEVLDDAVKTVKNTLETLPASAAKKVSFHSTVNETRNFNEESFQSPVKKSALNNLKSPYKKLLNTSFPSNLKPGSTEKRRKHPAYFTAKIDVDEIQSNREEYGERGSSLKAFRLDQEEAAKRVNDLLDEAEEVDSSKKGFSSSSIKTTSLFTNSSSDTSLSIAPSTTTTQQQATTSSSGLLAALQQPVNKLPPTISFSAPTPTLVTTAGSSTTSSSTTGFAFPSASSTAASTTAVVSSTATKSVSFTFNASKTETSTNNTTTATATNGFSLPVASTAFSTVAALTSASSNAATLSNNFSFAPTGANEKLSSAASTSSIPAAGGFSFGSNSSSSFAQTTSLNIATTTTIATSAPTFNFGAASSTKSTTPAAQVSTGFTFGSVASTQSTSVPSIFGGPTTATSTSAGVAPSFSFGKSTATSQVASTAPIAASNLFQAPVSVTAAPSVSATGSVFGNVQTAKPTTGFSFNASTTSNAPSVGFNFGAPSATTAAVSQTASIFGGTSTQGMFGKPSSAVSGFSAPAISSTGLTTPAFVSSVPNTSASIFAAPQNAFSTTTTTSNIFGSSATASAFGAPSTTASVFGAPSATAGVFGAPSTTASVFGAPSSAASVFGAPSSTASVFGAPSSTASVFGAPATTKASIFGAPSSQGVFNAPASSTASIFGAPSTNNAFAAPTATANPFGGSSAPTANIFGNSTTTAAGGFSFGTTSTAKTTSSTGFSFGAATTQSSVFGGASASGFGSGTTGSVFGQPQAAATAPTPFGSASAGSVFGAPAASAAQANPFGGQNQAKTGFDFSASLKQGPTLDFKAAAPATNNMFGTPSSAPKPFGFGNTPSTPSFGANPATPSFGTPQQPSFGTPQAPAFGMPTNFNTPAGAGGGFTIGAGASNPPQAGRQTQRARRRLRK